MKEETHTDTRHRLSERRNGTQRNNEKTVRVSNPKIRLDKLERATRHRERAGTAVIVLLWKWR